MAPARLPLVPAILAALGLAALMGWLGLTNYLWTDYEYEALPAFSALVKGDLVAFLELAPAYGGSLIIRSPFALLPDVWGGGEMAVYRAAAAPCLLAGAVLGVLLAHLRSVRFGWNWTAAIVLALAAANPITLRALEIGHPEELFGGVLCVLAVLAALARRPVLAGALLGLALANKAWAVLAIAPVLLALPQGRLRAAGVAFGLAGLIMAPILLANPPAQVADHAHTTGTIFQPWQVWWFFGDTGEVIRGIDGNVKEGYRLAPAWLSSYPHPLIAFLVLPLGLLYARACRLRDRPAEDVLLLLALLFLLRCVLDPWNIGYYHLPFLMALLAWEAVRFRRAPALTLFAVSAIWFTLDRALDLFSPDLQAVLYLAWALPLVAVLARWTYGPPLAEAPVGLRGSVVGRDPDRRDLPGVA